MAKKISVTMLSSYLYCKRKLFLERVLKLFEPEKLALVKGSIRHETYDEINNVEASIVKSITSDNTFEDIYSLYARNFASLLRKRITANKYRLKTIQLPLINAYQEIWPFFQRESEIRALNIWKFIEKHNIYANELWEKLTPKVQSEIRIKSDSLELSGIIDKVETYEEGLVPIEMKTGSMPKEGVWPGHKIQLAAYALMLEEKSGKEIKEGFVHYLDTNERRQIVMNPFLKDEVKELKNQVKELLASTELPEKTENKNKCLKCGLREKCYDKKFMKQLIKSTFSS